MARLDGGVVNGEDVAAGSLHWQPHTDEGRIFSHRWATEKASLDARIPIRATEDIVKARQVACELAQKMSLSESQTTLITTAISELARNIILYAESGRIILTGLVSAAERAMIVEAQDNGPGIPDLQSALVGGYSTSGGLGLGLSALQRIVDTFEIRSVEGEGTYVMVRIDLR